jgi:Tol biopolymer transport system component
VSTSPAPSGPTTIAFYGIQTGGPARIFQVPPGGGDVAAITDDTSTDSDPKWSPDGTTIAFDTLRGGQREIFTFANGTYKRLTHTGNNKLPTWSRDGTQIAYDHSGQIWTMDADGSHQHQLTAGPTDSAPSWSVNNVIAFQRGDQVMVVPADGSAQPKVAISSAKGSAREPSWSPDGTQLAYAQVGADGVRRVVVANPDGSNATVLTKGTECPCQFPTWSPDGTQIAFESDATTKERIGIVPVGGGAVTFVTPETMRAKVPGWGS